MTGLFGLQWVATVGDFDNLAQSFRHVDLFDNLAQSFHHVDLFDNFTPGFAQSFR